jgi:hypothetical protein
MGFLSQVLGKKPDYPPLEASDPAAGRIGALKEPLERLAKDLPDPLEIVPTERAAYAFIGKPPKKFGIAWVDADGKIHNFKSLVEEQGLSVVTLEKLSDELKTAYIRGEQEDRFKARLGERDVVVTPSETLAADIGKIISKYSS